MLQDMVVALPESWVMQQIGRAHKRHMGTQMRYMELDPYKVGLMRLDDMNIRHGRISELGIIEIGRASIRRKPIMVLFVHADWIVVPYSYDAFREFRGHGFVIRDKHVHKFSHEMHKKGTLEELMRAYEEKGNSIRINDLDAEGLCRAFQGRATHKGKKACGMGVSAQPVQYRAEDHSRPWKRGERAHFRSENKKKSEAVQKEQTALNIIKVSKVGLIYKSNTKAVHYKPY